ncbi:hypothetical protein DB313_06120 (plasmid) [Borrelia turcica IST7]|uniref:Uncharacterized protein n=1 Tax=Borrelia turcica IST7 TaxID=1104446 RepID=A0A386PQ96_9SPIR|nr:hypothetical protein [Borrelia turcica]AYE37075.1 hypothetical protein DB313_06120 [Borrelia turcica IST7]
MKTLKYFWAYLNRIDPNSLLVEMIFAIFYFVLCYLSTLSHYRYDKLQDELSAEKVKQAWVLYEEHKASGAR